MKNFLLTLFLLFASSRLLTAQGWVFLQLEGTPGEVALQCADEGDDGFIYGIAEVDFDPYFVKLDADGELLAAVPRLAKHAGRPIVLDLTATRDAIRKAG